MRKLKSVIYCDKCKSHIIRPNNLDWKTVLDKAGWKWCCESWETVKEAKLLCKYCTFSFELRNDIDPKTGMKFKETK